MGHVTFLGLLRRETLSVFHCENRFARKFYHRREPLWISAHAELEAIIGVMILIEVVSPSIRSCLGFWGLLTPLGVVYPFMSWLLGFVDAARRGISVHVLASGVC